MTKHMFMTMHIFWFHRTRAVFVGIVAAGCLGACDPESDPETGPIEATAKAAHSEESQTSDAIDSPLPRDQSGAGLSKQGRFWVDYRPIPNPIPFQELFEIEVRISDPKAKEQPLQGAVLDSVQAIMPAHGHGMKVEPEIVPQSDGTFRVRGMRFHMQGDGEDGRWVLEFTVRQDKTVDLATFDLQCCRESS